MTPPLAEEIADPVGAVGGGARYEWRAVLLMTVGFGLVGLDRWVIADLAGLRSSTMTADLRLRPQDVGALVAALGVAWGVSSLFMGGWRWRWCCSRCCRACRDWPVRSPRC